MFDIPVRYSRPLRAFDGGDVFEGFDIENAQLAWVDFNVHDSDIRMLFPEDTDLRIGDIVEVDYSTQIYGRTMLTVAASISSIMAVVA